MKKNLKSGGFLFVWTLCACMISSFIGKAWGNSLQGESLEVYAMNSFWKICMETVLPSIITSLVTAAVTYFAFLRKMPESIKDKLEAKIDPSNKTLFDTLNLLTHQYSNHKDNFRDLHKDHDAIQHDLQELVLRGRLNEDTYKQMSADQRAVVDSVKKLEFFSQILQETVARNELLQVENKRLQERNEKLQAELHTERQKNHSQYDFDHDDYEMEL